MSKRLLVFAVLLAMRASMFSQSQPCQWSLGINGQLCGFRPFSSNSLWNTPADSMPTDREECGHPEINRQSTAVRRSEVPYIVVDSAFQPMVPVTLTTGAAPKGSDFAGVASARRHFH